MQEKSVIIDVSLQLKSYEKNYPIYDLELALVIFALMLWQHYIYGMYCEITWTTGALSIYLLRRN